MSRTDRVRAHGLGVGGEGEEAQAVEDHPVEEAVDHALGGQQHDEHHHELGVEDQEPGDDAAHDAAAVADEPHGVGAVAERGRGAVLGPQVAGLPLDVPGAVRRAHHPTTARTATACWGRRRGTDGEEEGEQSAGEKREERDWRRRREAQQRSDSTASTVALEVVSDAL
ncbi:hypothetical protein EYF80_027955 [Liparis tanakae]|uniref:Uncharacterized protein n=1 Tax=Liparis tanakae TaxID=230148 RepID=A0A4Z2H7C7_9TELE|nr:hypothetical protein EYF80_027955 [Liparis tanakae]